MNLGTFAITMAAALLTTDIALAQEVAGQPSTPVTRAPVVRGSETGAGPLDNTTVGNARILVPDGTSYYDATSNGWFIARLEAGKSYVVESENSDNDGGNNITFLSLFESDGTTPWANANFETCGPEMDSMAPSLEAAGGGDGARCSVGPQINVAAPSTRVIAIQVGGTPPYHVRVRETTVYSRWTTNGYNMYVALHNSNASQINGVALYYPENGATDNAPNSFNGFNNFQLGARSSTQFVRASGSTGPTLRGQMRILLFFSGLPGGTHVHVQTYAYNTAAGQYLMFTPEHINWQSNSW